jgi:hypothetical protein
MPFDPARLRALAEASQAASEARDEENAARELAQFKSERLAAFSEWLNVELERVAGCGLRSATLWFDLAYFGKSLGKAAFNEPDWHKRPGMRPGQLCWHAYLCKESVIVPRELPEDRVFWVGTDDLPIDWVVGYVIESAQKSGIAARKSGISAAYDGKTVIELS